MRLSILANALWALRGGLASPALRSTLPGAAWRKFDGTSCLNPKPYNLNLP